MLGSFLIYNMAKIMDLSDITIFSVKHTWSLRYMMRSYHSYVVCLFIAFFTVWWWHLRVWGLFEDTDGLPASIYSHISNIYPSSGASELPETFSIRHQLYGPHVLWTILYFNWFDCWIYILFNLCADCGSLFSLFSLLIRIELLVNVFMKKLDRIEHKDNKS